MCPHLPRIWGILGSARGAEREGLLSHHAFGTNTGPYFSRVGVCVYSDGFGSRHMCSEQVGQASLPAGNSGMCLFGLCSLVKYLHFLGVERFGWRNGYVPVRLVAHS